MLSFLLVISSLFQFNFSEEELHSSYSTNMKDLKRMQLMPLACIREITRSLPTDHYKKCLYCFIEIELDWLTPREMVVKILRVSDDLQT